MVMASKGTGVVGTDMDPAVWGNQLILDVYFP